ncbi:MAG: UDP-N-acetylmuramoyl-L-alanyl-D-glutamate--2,6-diaminopimelate ligase [Clostridia bacterium]|nr:UDP-N-acetylmuramoyl-L-alanyl-D-glutamate--2,6-diaminopimelate ligase [Clostridia bacterium]
MKLTKLYPENQYNYIGNPAGIEVKDIIYDSRREVSGNVFVCLKGFRSDGHIYAKGVYERGCRAFVCMHRLELPEDAVQIICEDTRIALAEGSMALFDHPERKLKLIGITGTKGKTTVASLIWEILNSAGHKAAYIGTNGINITGVMRPTVNSTPESYILAKSFAEMVECGIKYAVMEVSSQAYLMNRVHGLEFYIGIYTNLSPDHISDVEHPDFENYRDCKAMLFKHSKYSIFNADDEHYTFMARHAASMRVTYAMNAIADFRGQKPDLWRAEDSLGINFDCHSEGSINKIELRIPGVYNVYNALAAVAASRIIGIPMEVILQSLSSAVVKGRFEMVRALPNVTMIIDYAHNDLSLRSVLETIRRYHPKRLICLFGSVGGKSHMRREELGRAAGELCDYCIITSDNPDYEEPMEIMKGIEKGILPTGCRYKMIEDRTDAVKAAVEGALAGDVILFAGKGHEDYQLIKGERVPMSERAIIEEVAAKKAVRA